MPATNLPADNEPSVTSRPANAAESPVAEPTTASPTTPASGSAIPEADAHDYQAFLEQYYRPEQPVVFRGVCRDTPSAEEIRQRLSKRIQDDTTVTHRLLWYDVKPDLVTDICETPPVVAESLNPESAFLRQNCVRVWFNAGGHTTPWHYDGHSLHVFNLQLKGKKRWSIVAPETPLLNMPMSKTCVFENNSMRGKRHYEFELDEGDMVFLPRYWFHHVHSVGQVNVNVNWVLMPKQAPPETKIARRESEMLWLMDRNRFLLPGKTRGMLDSFAGVGKDALDRLTEDVSVGRGVGRLAKELLRSPMVLLAIPTQIAKASAVLKGQKVLQSAMKNKNPAPPTDPESDEAAAA